MKCYNIQISISSSSICREDDHIDDLKKNKRLKNIVYMSKCRDVLSETKQLLRMEPVGD